MIQINNPLFNQLPPDTFTAFSEHTQSLGIISSYDQEPRTWNIEQDNYETSLIASTNVILETLIMFMSQVPQVPEEETPTPPKPRIHLL